MRSVAPAAALRLSWSTVQPSTAVRGSRPSMTSRERSRSSRGTPLAPADRRIRLKASACLTSRTVSPDFIDEVGLDRPHVVGVSFGAALALQLYQRHPAVPRTLTLVGAYAGWAGSLPREIVDERLRRAIQNAERPPASWAPEMVATYFSEAAPTNAHRRSRRHRVRLPTRLDSHGRVCPGRGRSP